LRILIADDNDLIRRGIAGLLAADGLQVCGEARDSAETIQKASDLQPDLVLLDVSMPGISGLETARQLRRQFPSIKILIMSQHDPAQLATSARDAGAHGCVDKARLASDLLPAIRQAAVG
jgi:DNA-binding NarL/FixJ family response regulator